MARLTAEQTLRDRFRGALLGLAVGDALGAPYEGFGPPQRLSEEALLRWDGPLRYTDDTHMTLGLAESLVACRGFDGAHLAAVFARNYFAEPWRGYGAGPPQVFRLLERGVPWDQAGRMLFGGSGSFGNGAAMRVAPVALLAYRDLRRVEGLARDTSVITHAHELGVEGAVLQALAIALLLQQPEPRPFDARAFLAKLRRLGWSQTYHQKLDGVEALVNGSADDPVDLLGNGIAAFEAVPAAIYAFLRAPASFPAILTTAINLGGDTDTIAAMAGALAGAHLGEGAIPTLWREGVEGAAHLRHLADDLLALALESSSSASGDAP